MSINTAMITVATIHHTRWGIPLLLLANGDADDADGDGDGDAGMDAPATGVNDRRCTMVVMRDTIELNNTQCDEIKINGYSNNEWFIWYE